MKEHFPNIDDKTKALCGEKRNPIILDLNRDNDPDFFCKRCQKLACEDCLGTGILGGTLTGIYCNCDYAWYADGRK